MTFTRIALAGGVVLLGVLCWLAAIGFTAATEILVTVFALFVLVGGGNWLSGRSGRPGASRGMQTAAAPRPEPTPGPAEGEPGTPAP